VSPAETASRDPKEASGRRAAGFVEDGMTLGLGTGSTVHFALLGLSERIRAEGLRVRGVPTSLDTERKAREWGIPLLELGAVDSLDLAIDGADEIDAQFRMIKGGGGALLREKVVASLARRVVIVVGENKVVARLGTTFALPSVARAIARLGCTPRERQREGKSYRTDNGNAILDCSFAQGIADPGALERALRTVPGVVESGLFLGLAHVLVVGKDDGSVEVRER